MQRSLRSIVGVLVALTGSGLVACGGDSGPTALELDVAAGCNPLGSGHCMTPWPSSAFEIEDTATATGRHLAIPAGTLPTNVDDIAGDPAGWNTADGFSAAAPLLVTFPTGVSAAGLPSLADMAPSLAAASPTVLIDMATGARVAHYAELDAPAAAHGENQALMIRPAQRLLGGHRYAVAITTRVHAPDGGPLPVPAGFAALRDGTPTTHPLLEAMRPRFGAVLAALAAAGVPQDELVVAWDFTTASDAYVRRDALAARDRAVSWLDTHPIDFTIATDDETPADPQIRRTITGTFDAPLFLTNAGRFMAGTVIARDAEGLPVTSAFYRVPFTAIIPACAYTAATPVPMVVYGHGLMGSSSEVAGGVQRTTAAELCAVFVATDMRGMSTMDLPAIARALNELSHADEVMEVLVQGIVNHVALVRALRTTFASRLFVTAQGASLVDATKVSYYGISQGAIFGTSILAYEPTMTRAALAVGGANYSTLLDRSLDWPTYRGILEGAYPDPLDITLAVSLFQMRWDKTEGSGVAADVLAGTAFGGPPKQVLMQIALGDEQVPNVGSYWQARTMGIAVLAPSPLVPWGLSAASGPLPDGSALVLEDGGAPSPPEPNVAPGNFHMHDLTRNQPASRRQIGAFFATGIIANECAGACVCTTTACN